MKRHPALRQLSRDHHRALVVAQRLRRAKEPEAAEAGDEFVAFWNEQGAIHFSVEEEVLLPRLAEAGGFDEDLIGRVLRDHAEIRLGALELRAGPVSGAQLRELGERLEAHVRLEERQLFPLIEASIPERELTALARELAEAEKSRTQA